MSTFVVENKTINSILGIIRKSGKTFSMEPDSLQERDLGFALLWMNVDAVNQRYGESNVASYEYAHDEAPKTHVQAYKTLSGFLYQCDNGNVPKRELYKALREFKRDISEKIIHGLDEFDKAEWV